MNNAQQCICRWVMGRRFYGQLCRAAGGEVDLPQVRDEDSSPLSCLQLTEHSVDRLLEGLARDRTAECVFETLVRGKQCCVARFWSRFPGTLMTWVRSCCWQKLLSRVDCRKLDARTRQMLRQINRETNTLLARRLDELDPAGLAKRIDAVTGLQHANIVVIYTIAYFLRITPPVWRQFQEQLAQLKQGL